MPKISLRRSFLIFVLTLMMVPSLASAARPAWGWADWGRTAWDLLFRESATGSKLGCSIDPDGKPRCTR